MLISQASSDQENPASNSNTQPPRNDVQSQEPEVIKLPDGQSEAEEVSAKG